MIDPSCLRAWSNADLDREIARQREAATLYRNRAQAAEREADEIAAQKVIRRAQTEEPT